MGSRMLRGGFQQDCSARRTGFTGGAGRTTVDLPSCPEGRRVAEKRHARSGRTPASLRAARMQDFESIAERELIGKRRNGTRFLILVRLGRPHSADGFEWKRPLQMDEFLPKPMEISASTLFRPCPWRFGSCAIASSTLSRTAGSYSGRSSPTNLHPSNRSFDGRPRPRPQALAGPLHRNRGADRDHAQDLPDGVRTRTLDAVRKGTGTVELRTRVESNETELVLVPTDGSEKLWLARVGDGHRVR
jgi:hypothetical protein